MEEFINVEMLKTQWPLVQSKLDKIGEIFQEGRDSDGIEIDEEGITIKSSTYFSGCGTDHFSHYVAWDDINKPIEYFQDLKKQQDENERARKQKNELASIKEKEKEEINKLKILKAKYPNI